jgi:imidazolonepropionase-like amidohydrolase
MSREELAVFYQGLLPALAAASAQSPGFFYQLIPEFWNHLGAADPRVLALVARMKTDSVGVTPTLHVFAGPLGLAYFPVRNWRPQDDASGLTPQQRARAIEGYRIMASYVKRMYDSGVRLSVGTDALDPGKAVLSEMLLLHDAGIPMAGVFRIATLNSAVAIGYGGEYGSIEVGKRANMVLFDQDPLSDPRNLTGGKLVIKDGAEWTRRS